MSLLGQVTKIYLLKTKNKKMTKDLKILAFLAVSASVWFLFNPIQDTEVNMKLQTLCQENPQYKCSEITSYCIQALTEGKECYLIK